MVWSAKNPLSVMVVVHEKNNNHMGDQNYKSVHLTYQHKTGSHGKDTEYLCYDCWSKSQTSPRPHTFLNFVTFRSTWMDSCLSELGSHSHRPRGL